MLWLAKIKKRLPFNRRRRRVNKALRRRKLEKYMPVILFLLGLLVIMIAIVALLVVKIGMPFYETITEPHAARDWSLLRQLELSRALCHHVSAGRHRHPARRTVSDRCRARVWPDRGLAHHDHWHAARVDHDVHADAHFWLQDH